jgi:hypothetical protein
MAAIVTMMLDVSLARAYDLVAKQPTSIWRIATYAAITAMLIASQYFIMENAGKKTASIRSVARLHIRAVHYSVRASQIVLSGILIFLVMQTILTQRYFTDLLIAIVSISYGSAVLLLGLLAQRFFSWSISNKSNVIILYALASASLSINAGFTLFYVNDVLMDRSDVMKPYSAGSMVSIPPNSERALLNSGFFVSSIVSFGLLWGETAVLLSHYSLKLGRLRYWMVIASPLVLFLGQFAGYLARLFDPLLNLDPVSSTIAITIIFTLSKPIGGILFGVGFFTIAKNFRENPVLRNYLLISAFGFVLLYVSSQASVLLVTPFPPFGAPSTAFVGLASYLILLGIYSSVISISEDVKLRHLLRKTAIDRSRLLDRLASAHMKEEIHKKAVNIIKDNSDKLTEVTGVEPAYSEKDLKQYVDEVMKELYTSKKRFARTKDVGEETVE